MLSAIHADPCQQRPSSMFPPMYAGKFLSGLRSYLPSAPYSFLSSTRQQSTLFRAGSNVDAIQFLLRQNPSNMSRNPPSKDPSRKTQSGKFNDTHWRLVRASDTQAKMKTFVSDLSITLACCYPKKVASNMHAPSTPGEVVTAMVESVIQLFTQLRSHALQSPILVETQSMPEVGTAVTLRSDEFNLPIWNEPISPPYIIFLNDNITLPPASEVDPYLPPELEPVLDVRWSSNRSSYTLFTDLSTILIIHPPLEPIDVNSPSLVYEAYSLRHPNITSLAIIFASFTSASLPRGMYLQPPSYPYVSEGVFASGAATNPSTPMIEDNKLFQTHTRNSDFDLFTLQNDPQRQLQYIRWKEYMQAHPGVLHQVSPGDFIKGLPNKISKPLQPLDAEHSSLILDDLDLPKDTLTHMAAITRQDSLNDLLPRFSNSSDFQLQVLAHVNPEEIETLGVWMYRCQLTHIDGDALGQPRSVILRLFDDAAVPFDNLGEPVTAKMIEEHFPDWWSNFTTSEDWIRAEEAVYDKLLSVQGGLVPRLYGSHLFLLPDGTRRHGILSEDVPGIALEDIEKDKVSEEGRISLIKSARHGLRVLQALDISQQNWSSTTVLVVPSAPSASISQPGQVMPQFHLVFTDLASMSRTLNASHTHRTDDYGELLQLLLEVTQKLGMDARNVCEVFGDREGWDNMVCDVDLRSGSGEKNLKRIARKDPFAFVFGEN